MTFVVTRNRCFRTFLAFSTLLFALLFCIVTTKDVNLPGEEPIGSSIVKEKNVTLDTTNTTTSSSTNESIIPTCSPWKQSVYHNFTFMDYPSRMQYRDWTAWDYCKIAVYVVLLIIALVGNSLVILVVKANRVMQSPINYLIVNLAVADILISAWCMWVHLVNDLTHPWFILGDVMCKMTGFVHMAMLTCCVLTLTVIAIERFLAVMFPLRMRVLHRNSKRAIAGLWISSILIASPFLVYRKLTTNEFRNFTEVTCVDLWPKYFYYDEGLKRCVLSASYHKFYYLVVSLTLFFLPIAIMFVAYSFIAWKACLSSRSMPGAQGDSNRHTRLDNKWKIVKMIIAVLILFVVCWTPLQVAILYSIYATSNEKPLPPWYDKFLFYFYLMAYSNSSFNPLIYGGMSSSFRQGFLRIFGIQASRRRFDRANTFVSMETTGRMSSRLLSSRRARSQIRANRALTTVPGLQVNTNHLAVSNGSARASISTHGSRRSSSCTPTNHETEM